MKLGMLGLVLVSSFAFGNGLPVDDEIAALRAKATYLETLKTLLEKNTCAIAVETNTVPLVAGALRSQGLVVAVGEKFPGDYLAYDKAPKPEQLERVVGFTFLKAVAGKNAKIISGQIHSQNGTDYSHFVVYVAEPSEVKGAENLWMYHKTNLALKLSGLELSGTAAGKSASGVAIGLECKPR